MATPKEAHALVTYFGQRYSEKYGSKPVVNRYQSRWGFDSLLIDLKADEVKKLIDYYFTTISNTGHSLEWFFYNYEKLAVAMEDTERDRASLDRIREETRLRTQEWRRRRGLED